MSALTGCKGDLHRDDPDFLLPLARKRPPFPHDLSRYVRHANGWEYEVEGSATHPKPGLITRTPGATLELCRRFVWQTRAGSPTRA